MENNIQKNVKVKNMAIIHKVTSSSGIIAPVLQPSFKETSYFKYSKKKSLIEPARFLIPNKQLNFYRN